ncbi:hypothetical protein SFC07_01430 [Corynebacterium callunae]|uniref:hypothetical protein n=1 Tax=Corynebacterium callunae TaxID=1721 RepID=UPI003982C048
MTFPTFDLKRPSELYKARKTGYFPTDLKGIRGLFGAPLPVPNGISDIRVSDDKQAPYVHMKTLRLLRRVQEIFIPIYKEQNEREAESI